MKNEVKIKNKINSQYRIATFFAIFTTAAYGFMRLYEGVSYNAWEDHGYLSFYMSIVIAIVLLLMQLVLRNHAYAPLVIMSTMTVSFAVGAYITTEWDFYHIASVSMTGLICLYGRIRPVIIYYVVSSILNIGIFRLLAINAPEGFISHMFINFFLYLFGAIYIIVLFYLANKKEGVAQSGLKAFSSLLGSTPNLMVIVDDKRRVRYISAALARFAGMDEAVAIGRPLVDLFKAESLKLMFADILDADGSYSATREIDVKGEPHYFKIIADKLHDNNAGMFIEITDMTEIVLASIKADESRKEAEVANNSKSAFLTTMSHEIRTPMNAIIGVSEIQLSNTELPNDIAQAFRQIHISGHGLLGIINDVLDLSKIETGKLEINSDEYDIASLINDAVQLNLIRMGSKNIVFLLDVEPDLPARMLGDEIRLKQILNNLLSNAFKYTDEGSVKLSVTHRIVENGIELVFKVADTGQGLKPEDLARLFEEYSRFNIAANLNTEGTGLGMSITQRLVNMMNGSIDVESEFGKGSVFTITVLQQPSEDKSVIGEEHAEKLRNFTYTVDREIQGIHIRHEYMPYGRVLVVDDVETNLYVARGLLTPYGLTIETASSGFEAIEMIFRNEVYDIVFMDHMMPKMDGIETTHRLREGGYKGVIVALTANAIVGNDKFFKENGFDDFISKPIDMRHMDVVLNQYIRDRQRLETPTQTEVIPAITGVDKTLLEIFKRDARKAVAALTQSAENGDYKLFATAAHAMKSASLNIGENKISEIAKGLEKAGNESDEEFIKQHKDELISALTEIIGEDNTVTSEISEEDIPLLLEKLEQIREACEDYDGGAVRGLLKELSGRTWMPETAAALDEISEMVLCSDFDEAAEKASELLNRYDSI